MRDENVGVITRRSNKSYLILDSIDFWFDLIQEKYPAKQKCNCKNEYFKVAFNFVPRIGTDDSGIHVDRDIWRKKEIIVLNAPLLVAAFVAGKS